MDIIVQKAEYLLSKLGVTLENTITSGGCEEDYVDNLMHICHSAMSMDDGLFVYDDRCFMVLNFTDSTFKAIEIVLDSTI